MTSLSMKIVFIPMDFVMWFTVTNRICHPYFERLISPDFLMNIHYKPSDRQTGDVSELKFV